ncbi:MAG: RHS repeat-associated core domain-containing protein, partial [Myxococcota bacterium]
MRLSTIRHVDGTGSAIHDLAIELDRANHVLGVTDNAASGVDQSANFTLDDWYRVTQVDHAERTETFEMDVLDRIVSKSGEAMRYSDAQPLAAASISNLSLSHDDAGYLVAKNGMTLVRDDLGRIEEIQHDGVTTGVHGHGRSERVLQMTADGTLVLYGFNRYEVRDGVGTTFVSLGQARIARHENPGAALGFYLDGNGNGQTDAGDALFATDRAPHLLAAAAARLLVDNEAPITFLHTNHLGSHIAATDEDGIIRGQQTFAVHGLPLSQQGYIGAYGFTGQEKDETTGLIHMTFRDLDPSTGRWDAFDPSFITLDRSALARLGEATTGYAYVANNPGSFTDPTGLNIKEKAKRKFTKYVMSGKAQRDFSNLFRVPQPPMQDRGPRAFGSDSKVKLKGGKIVVSGKFLSTRFFHNVNEAAVRDRRSAQRRLNQMYTTPQQRAKFVANYNAPATFAQDRRYSVSAPSANAERIERPSISASESRPMLIDGRKNYLDPGSVPIDTWTYKDTKGRTVEVTYYSCGASFDRFVQ